MGVPRLSLNFDTRSSLEDIMDQKYYQRKKVLKPVPGCPCADWRMRTRKSRLLFETPERLFIHFAARCDLKEFFDMSPFTVFPREQCFYELESIIVRVDECHYVTYVRIVDNNFMRCDDTKIQPCSKRDMREQIPYMACYRRTFFTAPLPDENQEDSSQEETSGRTRSPSPELSPAIIIDEGPLNFYESPTSSPLSVEMSCRNVVIGDRVPPRNGSEPSFTMRNGFIVPDDQVETGTFKTVSTPAIEDPRDLMKKYIASSSPNETAHINERKAFISTSLTHSSPEMPRTLTTRDTHLGWS
jgi:hypothetical protein